MSRGPGRVERKIVDLFRRKKRNELLSTYDVCCDVFGTHAIEKKHRVSVLRAMKRISESGDVDIWRIVLRGQPDDVLVQSWGAAAVVIEVPQHRRSREK